MHQDKEISSTSADSGVKKSIHRASLLLMGSILISRLIGFFREWVLAQTVGANAQTDVYYASFTIPDFLNYLMAAGALGISFIPILSQFVAEGKTRSANEIFRCVTTVMGSVLVVFIIVAEIYARSLGELIAPGFSSAQLDELGFLIRIILPAQLFFYWGGLAVAVQHVHGKFLIPAIAPIVYNLGIIAFGLMLQKTHGVVGFSVGVLVGSFVGHGLLQVWAIRRLGFSPLPLFRFSSEVKAAFRRYIWLTIPIMFGFSIVMADEWFGKYFASSMKGSAVSWLQYARIEMRIPVSVIGQAAGIASFPFLAKLWSNKKYNEYGANLLREIQKLWAASLLAVVVCVIHALPITHFIYGGGKFTAEDLAITSRVLQCFGLGIFFLTVQGLLSRGFYACQRTWLPSIVGTSVSVLAVGIYWYLGKVFGVQGLALAGSLSFGVYAIALWLLLTIHLQKSCTELPWKAFYQFCGLWLIVAALLSLVSYGILELGIYQGTRMTALADVLVTVGVISVVGLILLRKVFPKLTNGPLF